MGRWLLVFLIAMLVVNVALPFVIARLRVFPVFRWLRLGRLPGDINFDIRGRPVFLPFTSTLLLSLLFTMLMRYL